MVILVWKTLKGIVPNSTGLDPKNLRRLGTGLNRPTFNYEAQTAKSTLYENSFGVRAARLWASVPRWVRDSTTLLELKRSLGAFLALIPDLPPVRGYSTEHANSLVDWRGVPSVYTEARVLGV